MRPPFLLASLILAAAPFAHCPPNTGGAGATTTAPTCEPAADNAPECIRGECGADADCNVGTAANTNYCAAGCARAGCASGQCNPTKPQGVACARAEECYFGCCLAGVCGGGRECADAGPGVNLRDGGAGP